MLSEPSLFQMAQVLLGFSPDTESNPDQPRQIIYVTQGGTLCTPDSKGCALSQNTLTDSQFRGVLLPFSFEPQMVLFLQGTNQHFFPRDKVVST